MAGAQIRAWLLYLPVAMDLHRFVTIVLPIAAVRLVAREAPLERANRKPGPAIFPTILSFRISSFLGAAMLLLAPGRI